MCAVNQEPWMSMQTINTLVPPSRPVPPGAALAAAAVVAVHRFVAPLRADVARWVKAMRARGAVKRATRRDARDRAEVFAMALRYSASQPEFAKDLFAAVARSHSS
jgi:hypothetical protein